jgi:hypothetical protein
MNNLAAFILGFFAAPIVFYAVLAVILLGILWWHSNRRRAR